MTPELAAFSDWVLALLPRLFLHPGGLWMLAGLMVIRIGWIGRAAFQLRWWFADVSKMNLAATATSWAALAIVPLPGAQPLPVPVDRWSVLALLAISLLLDLERADRETRITRAIAGAGITLSLLAPIAGKSSLLASPTATDWAASVGPIAIGMLILLLSGDDGIASGVRGLAWLSIALAPLWPLLPDWWAPTLAVFVGAYVVWRVATRIKGRIEPARLMGPALLIQWLLALGALLAALLFSR